MHKLNINIQMKNYNFHKIPHNLVKFVNKQEFQNHNIQYHKHIN